MIKNPELRIITYSYHMMGSTVNIHLQDASGWRYQCGDVFTIADGLQLRINEVETNDRVEWGLVLGR